MNYHSRSGRPSEEVIKKAAIVEICGDGDNFLTRIRRLSNEFKYPYTSSQRTLENTLKIYPYKYQMLQEFFEEDKAQKELTCAKCCLKKLNLMPNL